uniref:C-type lectin domain family 4 member E-like n=1 Tax=Centroberyx gerrardi TaxID=166262 RepID=UPI003AB0C479
MSCQTGWRKFEISCYYISAEKRNWTVSRQDCKSKGADLAVINSKEEQIFVNGLSESGTNAWIGMTDTITEGNWTWVDGTPVTTTYWQPGQPNSYSGNQDCGEMVHTSSKVGEWNDDGCFSEQVWICEK